MDGKPGNNGKNGRPKMRQASLIDILPDSPALVGLVGLWPEMRARMNRAAKQFEPGRKVLADRISDIAEREGVPLTSNGGKRIDGDQLNKWLQPHATGHGPKIEGVICFCLAVGSFEPLTPVLEKLRLVVIAASDLPYLEIGKAQAAMEEAREAKAAARAQLKRTRGAK